MRENCVFALITIEYGVSRAAVWPICQPILLLHATLGPGIFLSRRSVWADALTLSTTKRRHHTFPPDSTSGSSVLSFHNLAYSNVANPPFITAQDHENGSTSCSHLSRSSVRDCMFAQDFKLENIAQKIGDHG